MRRVLILLTTISLLTVLVSAGADAQWGRRNTVQTSLSVLAVMDTQTDEKGFAGALTMRGYGGQVSDLAYVSLDTFRIVQFSQSAPQLMGMMPINLGFAVAYADADSGAVDSPDGLMTGLTLTLSQSELPGGLTLDLRANSLAADFNPVDWIAKPEVFWLGAGLSFSF